MNNTFFNRTVYVPSEKAIIISGCIDKDPSRVVNHVYEWMIPTGTVQFLPPIEVPRSSFGIYYKFNDRFIYVIGGQDG